MTSRVGAVSEDFRKLALGYGLTTAEILYRMPDHRSLLQTYVWQDYDLYPKFPALTDFLAFWQGRHLSANFSARSPCPPRNSALNARRMMLALAGIDC